MTPANGHWPSVSVVVPTRNRPELLRRALESILAQNYPGTIDCVAVFDRCEPELPSVAERPGRNLRACVNSRTPGLTGTRNTGVLAGGGELVAFCDDDDEWLPDKLSLQVEALERAPTSPAATCGIELETGHRRIVRVLDRDRLKFSDLMRSRVMEAHASTFLVRRPDLVERIGLMDENLPGSYLEDYEWLLRASRVGDLVVVRRALVRVRFQTARPSQTAQMSAEASTLRPAALRYLLTKHPELESHRRGLSRIYGQIALAYAAAGERPQALSWARSTLRVNPTQTRGYLALLSGVGLVHPNTWRRLANIFGRGI
jgi:glycosyltransferase involved in cell wall biosynthesis